MTPEQMRIRMAEMAAEIERLQEANKRPAPCEKFCEAQAFRIEIRNLQAENAMLQKVIAEANAQEPFRWFLADKVNQSEDMLSEVTGNIDPVREVLMPMYLRPIPVQQSVDRQAIIDVLVASGNLSEGVTADLIISAIGAKQSPAVAVTDSDDSVSSIACTLHNYATQLHYAGNEKLADQLEEIVLRLWKCKPSPRITEQDAREIILNFYWYMEEFKNKHGRNPSVIEWWDEEGRALLDKLNNQPQNRRTGDIKIAEPADVLPEFK